MLFRSGLESNAVSVITATPPVALEATNLTQPTTTTTSSGTTTTPPTTLSFTLNWESTAKATGYAIDLSTASDFSSFVTGFNNLAVGNTLSYGVSNLVNTVYYFRVRAIYSSVVSSNSNVIIIENPGPAPVATVATNITSTSSVIEFTANWQAVSGATSYQLDVSTDSNFGSFVFQGKNVGNVTSYVVTGLQEQTNYYYRVTAVSTSSTGTAFSAYSNVIGPTETAKMSVLDTLSNITGVGGGGGAPSDWYLGALVLLALIRGYQLSKRHNQYEG